MHRYDYAARSAGLSNVRTLLIDKLSTCLIAPFFHGEGQRPSNPASPPAVGDGMSRILGHSVSDAPAIERGLAALRDVLTSS